MSEQTGTTEVSDGAEEQGAAVDAAAGEDYERASFDELRDGPAAAAAGETSLDVILDIPVTL